MYGFCSFGNGPVMRHSGIEWFRQRQRKLTLGVLASFCLVWLQLAALPCASAYAVLTAATPATHQLPAASTAHHAMAMPDVSTTAHCPYCPPDESSSSGGAGTHHTCSYPHSPQVDSRLTSLFTSAMPVAVFATTWFVEAVDSSQAGLAAEPAPVPPRTPLTARPSRLIE